MKELGITEMMHLAEGDRELVDTSPKERNSHKTLRFEVYSSAWLLEL
jgi:hypothetical protein